MTSLIITPPISARKQPSESNIKFKLFQQNGVTFTLIAVEERIMYSLIKGYISRYLVLSFVSYLCEVICFSKLLSVLSLIVLEIKLVYFCSFQF